MRNLPAVVLLALAPATAGAAELAGVVRDLVTERPLAGVRVEVDEGLLLVTTDQDGAFRLEVAAGPHRLRIQHRGHGLLEQRVQVAEGGPPLEIALRPVAVELHETVVVSARREPNAGHETPQSVSVLGEAELERQVPRTAPEALMDVTGVWVQKTNHGGGSPFLRGLSGNQVLVLVDGVRLNNSTFRYGPNQYLATVDPLALERVEVVRGMGSVQYGSDALGGVVSVFSARPELTGQGTALSGRFLGKLMSHDQEKSGRLELQASGPSAAIRGGLSLRDYGHLRAGGGLGVEAPSGYTERDGDLRAVLRLSDAHLLTAAYQHLHQSDVPRWDQVAQRGFRRFSFDPQVRQLAYAQLHSSLSSAWIESVSATLSFHRSDETRVHQRIGAAVTVTERDVVETWGWTVQARSRLGAGAMLVWGAEGYYDEIGSARRDADAATGLLTPRRGLYPDGATASSMAAFANAHWQWGRLMGEAGVRYNHHRVSATDATFGRIDVRPGAVVAAGALGYELAPGHRLFASAARGFRAPNVDDLSTLGLFDFGVEVPSPGLVPETAWTYELGWKARTRRLGAALAGYRTELSNLIDRVPARYEGEDFLDGQRVYRRANVGRAQVHGLEADLQWQAASDLTAFGNVTYTHGQVVSSAQPMRRIPPLNGLVGLRWDGLRRLSLDARLRFATRQDRLAPGDRDDHRIAPGGTPGWAVAGLRASYVARADVTVMAGFENVFDEAYRIHGSGIDGYGRHLWLAAQVRF